MDHEAEADAVLQAAAEAVGALVGLGREELADHVTGRERLDSVEATLPAAAGGGGVGVHHALDVVIVHLARDGAVQRLANGGRPDGRQPVLGVGVGPPPEVGDLAHECRPLAVHRLGEALQVGDDRVGADIELAEDVGAVAVDVGRPAEHGQRDAAARLFHMVGAVGLRGHPSLFQAAGVAGAHDAVAEDRLLDGQRLQKRVLRRGRVGLVGHVS